MNPFLLQAESLLKTHGDAVQIKFEWKLTKAKEEDFKRYVFKTGFPLMSENGEPKTKEKNSDFVIRSHHFNRNGWVKIHIWGANRDTVLNTLFLPYTTRFFIFT